MAGQIIKRGERTWLVRIFMGRDLDRKQEHVDQRDDRDRACADWKMRGVTLNLAALPRSS